MFQPASAPFVGGAQPFAPHADIPQSGPKPHAFTRLNPQILRAWEDSVWTVIHLDSFASQSQPNPPGGFVANPTNFSWVDPTTNANDNSAISNGEITGYSVGIRLASGTAGVYTTLVPVTGAAATSVAIPPLPAGSYAAAVQTVGPSDSKWSAEFDFTIVETPNPPTNFSAA